MGQAMWIGPVRPLSGHGWRLHTGAGGRQCRILPSSRRCRPARLGLIALCDELAAAGWPDGPGALWLHSAEYFVKAARRELAVLGTGDTEGDHVLVAALNLLQAAQCRALGR